MLAIGCLHTKLNASQDCGEMQVKDIELQSFPSSSACCLPFPLPVWTFCTLAVACVGIGRNTSNGCRMAFVFSKSTAVVSTQSIA